MRRPFLMLIALLLPLATPEVTAATPAAEPAAGEPAGLPTVAAKTRGLEAKSGFFELWLDRTKGKVFLTVPAAPPNHRGLAASFLYSEGITTGLGSNPVGLDRGQLGDTRVVDIRRLGPKILFEVPNLAFRALSPDPLERAAVRESFAPSVIWAGEVVAEDSDGRTLVDLTSFLLRDAHGIVGRLKAAEQGAFSLDAGRSVIDFDSALAFPDNVEIEAYLTYSSNEPGRLVRATAPVPEALSFVQHHSFVRLPDAGYRPRVYDPRAGSFSVDFADYAVPIGAPIERHWIVRHRLEKIDPTAARSRVKKPIVYYVDPGAPEAIRQALVEGASWWAGAFDRAGFIDAYRVELLPPGAHPLDVRYHVIQWVHRSTRGWSYGGGVTDPRTGEMIKGHVTLGSLRVRQDRLIFEGLLGVDKTGSGAPDDPVELSLARIRQLSAHEVGHTLGLSHNFAASTYGRASVMDYPAPLVTVGASGDLDVSQAYATGAGAWDVFAIRWAYGEIPPGADEAATLDGWVQEALAQGMVFLTDQDARPPGAAEPRANLWDNGEDPVSGLQAALAVRRVALDRFGTRNLTAGRPQALLHEVLVPIYLLHRYQLEAAVKVVGGLNYTYALQGDGQAPATPVTPERQQQALEVILGTLQPAALDLPEVLLGQLLPRPAGYNRHEEMFPSQSEPAFDPLGAAATAADMAVSGLLQRERANRLVDFHRRDARYPSFERVIEQLVAATFDGPRPATARQVELQRVVQGVVVRRLIDLAGNEGASPLVRGRAEWALRSLAARLNLVLPRIDAGHANFLAAEIARFLARPANPSRTFAGAATAPPGQPIGSAQSDEPGCAWDHP